MIIFIKIKLCKNDFLNCTENNLLNMNNKRINYFEKRKNN